MIALFETATTVKLANHQKELSQAIELLSDLQNFVSATTGKVQKKQDNYHDESEVKATMACMESSVNQLMIAGLVFMILSKIVNS